MTSYDTLRAADYSPLLVHLIRDKELSSPQFIDANHPLHAFKKVGAKDRLINILVTRTIYGSPMPWLPDRPEAVCFTECVWESLHRHTGTYSSFGVVFNKRDIFKRGGGPALYVRGDALASVFSHVPQNVEALITPFDPEAVLKAGVRLDFLDEREWRLPGSLKFDYSEVECIIVDSIQDAHDVALKVGEQHLVQNKFISVESYEVIRRAWGAR